MSVTLLENECEWIRVQPEYSFGYDEEHRLFRKAGSAEISIADHSGYLPSETEDGPLYVAKGSDIIVSYSHYSGSPRCRVEVRKEGLKDPFYVSCHPWIGRYLNREFGCNLILSDDFDKNSAWVLTFAILSNLLEKL